MDVEDIGPGAWRGWGGGYRLRSEHLPRQEQSKWSATNR